MKKVLAGLILVASAVSANAQMIHGHGWVGPGYYRHGGYNNNWIAPALIGGVIGYELSRPRYYEPPVIVQQQPVIVQQPVYSVTPQTSCTAWTETQQSDGTITRTRICNQ
jgi:hypothetical protein